MACNPDILKQVPLFALLDDEETARAVAGVHETERKRQPARDDGLEGDVGSRLGGKPRGGPRQNEGAEAPEYPSRESCSPGPQVLSCC